MKAYTYQIGEGTEAALTAVAYAQEVMADSLGEAIDNAKAVTNGRPEHAKETMVVLLDGSRPELQKVWARSVAEVRGGSPAR